MESKEIEDINSLCRSCMAFTDSCNFENYIIYNNEFTELNNMLEFVTSLKVLKDDGLPTILCNKCVEELKMSYVFKSRFIEINTKLQKLAMKINSLDYLPNDTIDTSITSIKKEMETHNLICKICMASFHSHYALSMHSINHNINKSLFERFESTLIDVKRDFDVNPTTNNYNLILINERKAYGQMVEESKVLCNGSMEFGNSIKAIENRNQNKSHNENLDLIGDFYKPPQKDLNNTTFCSCTLCNKVFSDTSSLSLHFLKHALASETILNVNVESEFFFCEICGQTFENEVVLTEHYNIVHKYIPTWTCKECNETFDKEQTLLQHDTLIHSSDVYQEEVVEEIDLFCVLCYERFITKIDLLKHTLMHLMKTYCCRKCSLSFCTQNSYFSHLQLHSGSKNVCNICGKHLSSKHALKLHISGVHSSELKYKCNTCNKGFSTSTRLKTHSLIHTDHKKHVCFYCGYSTHKVGDLQMHIRIHTSERPYKCTFANCTMRFKTSSHLCGHIRRHLQIRNFKCSNCSLSFTTSHALKVHQMQHTGEKPHCCIVCNRKFRRKYHVKIHMKQHIPTQN